ncbi:MAG: NhaA family Na+:H+ antiporter [Chlamydiales bacterium]|jgi:NhaA family Na+:H+ antiporter
MKLVEKFLRLETSGGFLLVGALTLAMLAVNSPFKPFYDMLLNTPVEIHVGPLHIAKPLLLWINDALMTIFFFLIGLELKREVLSGELSSPSKIALPAFAAIAGIAIPALIYTAINYGNPVAMKGWAIPTATDIAFALGVLSLLGSRVPASLKLLLLALAIIDDIGAIIIIAVFYSVNLSTSMFLVAAIALLVLAVLNWRNVSSGTPYILVGIILWIAVLKSGIHATIAGILLAMFIPLGRKETQHKSLLVTFEQDLHATVAYVILPIFAFANAGISFAGLEFVDLLAPIPLGVTLGLVIGKQLGIFGSIWLAVKVGFAKLPEKVTWLQIYGLSILCGIGFTMSLFISSLAFHQSGITNTTNDRLGIVIGSLISAVLGYVVLRIASKSNRSIDL